MNQPVDHLRRAGWWFSGYGDAVARIVNEVDTGLQVQTRNTKGSTEYIPLRADGMLDEHRHPAAVFQHRGDVNAALARKRARPAP